MNIDVACNALLWCAIINYALLILWFVLMLLPHDWIYRIWLKPLRVSAQQFDAINFGAMVAYKVAIILFFLTPYIALRIVGIAR